METSRASPSWLPTSIAFGPSRWIPICSWDSPNWKAGQFSEAVATFESVLDRGGDGSLSGTSLGVACWLKRYQAAIEQFDSVNCGCPEALCTTAVSRWGDLVKRQTRLPATPAGQSKLRPNYAQGRFKLGNVLALTDQFVAAAAQFRELICLPPDELKAYRQLDTLTDFREVGGVHSRCRGMVTPRMRRKRSLRWSFLRWPIHAQTGHPPRRNSVLQYATILSELTPRNAESSCLLAICLTASGRGSPPRSRNTGSSKMRPYLWSWHWLGWIARRQIARRSWRGRPLQCDPRHATTTASPSATPIILQLAGEPPPIEVTVRHRGD